jgi:dihydroorotate dehydrogenase
MSWLYRRLARPFLFTQDAETAHHRAMRGLNFVSRHPSLTRGAAALFGASPLPIELFGLRFPNPVGLAAGMDKYADALPAWPALGFGFAELGGVTWHAQAGNPKPRLFRAVRDEAIVNRMGFNNDGTQAFLGKLTEWREKGLWPNHPIGVNLGKSKITALEKAATEYAESLRLVLPEVDFVVVNVSSPNTPNLRQLQEKSALDDILAAMQEVQTSKLGTSGNKPILVKVAPDLSFEALDEILELVGPRQIAGIVAGNTTLSRPESDEVRSQKVYAEQGGLSGRPLRARSTKVVRHLYQQSRGTLPIIGVGGIFNAADAWEKISAGASLVQIYTGLVFEGPSLAREIVAGLSQRMEQAGVKSLKEVIGSEAR